MKKLRPLAGDTGVEITAWEAKGEAPQALSWGSAGSPGFCGQWRWVVSEAFDEAPQDQPALRAWPRVAVPLLKLGLDTPTGGSGGPTPGSEHLA